MTTEPIRGHENTRLVNHYTGSDTMLRMFPIFALLSRAGVPRIVHRSRLVCSAASHVSVR